MSRNISTLLLCTRGIRRGVSCLFRVRGSLTAIAAVTGVMLVGQIFFLMGIGAQGFDSLLLTESALQVPLKSDASDRQIQEFFAAVRQLPSVASVEYIPREKAMELGGAANPFIDVISVRFKDFWSSQGFSSFLRQSSWASVVDAASLSLVTEQQKDIYERAFLVSTARTIAWMLFLLAVAALFLLVVALVRRRAIERRQDIAVERMAGADDLSILLPFAAEVTVLLLGALFVGLACAALIVLALPSLFSAFSAAPWWTAGSRLLAETAPTAILVAFVVMPLLGWAGSIVGIRDV